MNYLNCISYAIMIFTLQSKSHRDQAIVYFFFRLNTQFFLAEEAYAGYGNI
jgi:hypothetical protein